MDFCNQEKASLKANKRLKIINEVRAKCSNLFYVSIILEIAISIKKQKTRGISKTNHWHHIRRL